MTRAFGDPGGLDRAADELALARDRLDQVDLGLGQRRGEDDAGEAGPRADVGDPPRGADELEPGERVGDVDAPGVGVADGAERGGVGSEQLEHRRQAARGAPGRARRIRRVGSVPHQRGDDHAALGLLALAEGLEPGPLLEVIVDELALGGGHRLELDLLPGLERRSAARSAWLSTASRRRSR